MPQTDVMPELKQILGALIFGANRPLSVREMRKCLVKVAETHGADTAAFGDVRDREILAALEVLSQDLQRARTGFMLGEVAGGYRLQSDISCGRWLKQLLDIGRPSRLSRPALETLSIIAYRQPVTKAAIESIRGVAVDHLIKTLMEMQLARITGRSELPGRPFLYGTTQKFLEHFGLKDLDELGDMEPLLKRMAELAAEEKAPPAKPGQAPAAEGEESEPVADEQPVGAEPALEPAFEPEPESGAESADDDDDEDEDEDEDEDDDDDDDDDDDR